MIRYNDTRSGRAWFSILLLVAVGMAAGAVLHSWLSSPAGTEEGFTEEHGDHEEHGEREAEESAGVIELSPQTQQAASIQTIAAELGPVSASFEATGVVAPDKTRLAHLRPLARGIVAEVRVQPGDRVTKGQVLLTYDNVELGEALADYTSAREEVRRSQSNLEVKRKILDRSREMLEVGALAKTVHDVREAEWKDAQARLASSEAAVAKIELQLRRFGLPDGQIRALREGNAAELAPESAINDLVAPFNGVIVEYEAAVGEYIQPEDELFSLADLSTVWVVANIYANDLGAVRAGQPVEVRTVSYPDRTFEGRVTYVGDVIDPHTRTTPVRCVVRNPDARLKLDMYATVSIQTGTLAEAVTVPAASVIDIDGVNHVFVQRSENQFVPRPVVIGAKAGSRTAIESGLEAGERVVSQGGFTLKSALLKERFAGGGHGH